jgi:hypothetical protein
MADVTGQQGMLTPPRHLIRYLCSCLDPCCLHSILYLVLWIMIAVDTLLYMDIFAFCLSLRELYVFGIAGIVNNGRNIIFWLKFEIFFLLITV